MQSAAGEAGGGGREGEMVGVGTPEVAFFFFYIYLCFHVLRCLFPFLLLSSGRQKNPRLSSAAAARRGEAG